MVEQLNRIDEAALRRLLKEEISRLTDGRIAADEIGDDEPLFSVPGECDSRIELDSLDALELSFALEQALGTPLPQDVGPEELITVDAATSTVKRLAADQGSRLRTP